MLRWIVGLALIFLLIDHVWVHYGPRIINSVASYLSGKEVRAVEEKADKKSIVDTLLERLSTLRKDLTD